MELLKSVENDKFLAVDCFKHATINDCLTNFRENTQPRSGPSQVLYLSVLLLFIIIYYYYYDYYFILLTFFFFSLPG